MTSGSMRGFAAYLRGLRSLLGASLQAGGVRGDSSFGVAPAELAHALDGGPRRALRSTVPLQTRRASGAFFTSEDLATRLWDVPDRFPHGAVADPACGAGDLLLTVARHLPVRRTLRRTLREWGRHLAGFDIHAEFVKATRVRLALLAISRGVLVRGFALDELDQTLPSIRCGDGLLRLHELAPVSHFLLNPPYSIMPAPGGLAWWGRGGVSRAALFIDQCLLSARQGARISAVLPDVLRSGTLYQRWREHVARRAAVDRIELVGRFEPEVDVDVFLLELTVAAGGRAVSWWNEPNRQRGVFGERFRIGVGSYVPFRSSGRGPWQPYLEPGNCPPWGEIRQVTGHKRYDGRLNEPPFLAIRRTSNPKDAARAVASLVLGPRPVAVENHLLVAHPKDGRIGTCREALAIVQSPKTNVWLNQRLRCRHLTLRALSELPWWSGRHG